MNADDVAALAPLYEKHREERIKQGLPSDPKTTMSTQNAAQNGEVREPEEEQWDPGTKTKDYEDLFQPVQKPNEVIAAVGPEGSGKTYFAATAPGPLHVIGTEAGHEAVTLAKDFPDKQIGHLPLEPEADGKVEDIWFGPWFGVDETLNKAIDVLDNVPSGTVIIDSASDLLGIAAASFNKQLQRGDNPIPPMLYGQLYPVLEGWIARLRQNHNVILCSRVKDEYKDDSKTGKKIVDLWKTGPYLAESIVWIERPPLGKTRFGNVTKGVNDGRVLYNPTFEAVTEKQPVEHDARPMRKALSTLRKAYEYAEKKGIPVTREVPSKLKDVQARIESIRERVQDAEASDG